MELIAITGGIASIAHLIEITGKTGITLLHLIEKLKYVPEELRRQQLSLRSIQTKLQLLKVLLPKLASEADIPPDIWKEFQVSLAELCRDIEKFASCIQPYSTGKGRITTVRERLRFCVCDRKVLTNALKHLKASEQNLQRIEDIIHLILTTRIHHNTRFGLTAVPKAVIHPLSAKSPIRRSRLSLLPAKSPLRRSGLHTWLMNEQTQDDLMLTLRAVICFGFCFRLLLAFLSLSLELAVERGTSQTGLKLQWNLRVQCRVPIDSPLMKACQQGDLHRIRQILTEKRAGVNDKTACYGDTALLWQVAIKCRQVEAVKYLLQNGADPNLSDDDQVTPLFAVAGMDPRKHEHFDQLPSTWNKWLYIFRLLVQHGASLHDSVRGRHIAGLNIVRDDQPSQALEYLGLLAAEDILQTDIISGRECWSALQSALRSGANTVNVLKLLHSAGVDLCKVMDDGRTALHLAAVWCLNADPLEYLYSIGCKRYVNKQDQWGWTALHYATVARNSALNSAPFSKVVSLVRNGADMKLEGCRNPLNHYEQPEGRFTPDRLLRFARPSRFDLLTQVFRDLNLEYDFDLEEESFHDANDFILD